MVRDGVGESLPNQIIGVTWHATPTQETLALLQTSEKGLKATETEYRLRQHGANELNQTKRVSALQTFLSQFKSILVLILLAATIISALIGEVTDALVITLIILANALLGFVQERRAEKALEAMKNLTASKARVMRDGETTEIPAREVVQGDILLLEAGDRVAADARLLHTASLEMDESSLTGESTPVRKLARDFNPETPLADRGNMVYMSTSVMSGRGRAVVVATAMGTELGKIAKLVQAEEQTETPLQQKLNRFGKQIGLLVVAIIIIIFAAKMLEGLNPVEVSMVAISLAVAAVPEGLPAIVTVTLALGVARMALKNAVVRRLSSVETLGSVTVICSDKTGTLTRNEMTVKQLYVGRDLVEVTGEGYRPEGQLLRDEMSVDSLHDTGISRLMQTVALCNDADLVQEGEFWRIRSDPTEGALLVAAAKSGIMFDELRESSPRIDEVPFSSERKRMTTINKAPDEGVFAYMKGAPEVVLECCNSIFNNGGERDLSKEEKLKILDLNQEMASHGLRLLGAAYKQLPSVAQYDPVDVERNMVFVGLVGMIDAPREEAKRAIMTCKEAGIKVVMITGDHKSTAVAVAQELGLIEGSGIVLTGAEVDRLNDTELDEVIEDVVIYARVSPEHKTRIVRALKKKGHIVAMTGDGVNDAPALKNADMGIAMGITGTEVSKEASDMVLADDNFATIVTAVEEGRRIYDNIAGFIRFLLAVNFAEVALIPLATVLGIPFPLLPVQILFVNVVTDGLPAAALGFDPPDPDVMQQRPRNPKEGLLSRCKLFILASTLLMLIGAMASFYWGLITANEVVARTMTFTQIVFFELIVIFNCRSETRSVFRLNPTSNRWLLAAVASSALIQLLVVYMPFFQNLLGTTPLDTTQWIVVLLTSSLAFLALPEFFIKRAENAFKSRTYN